MVNVEWIGDEMLKRLKDWMIEKLLVERSEGGKIERLKD